MSDELHQEWKTCVVRLRGAMGGGGGQMRRNVEVVFWITVFAFSGTWADGSLSFRLKILRL